MEDHLAPMSLILVNVDVFPLALGWELSVPSQFAIREHNGRAGRKLSFEGAGRNEKDDAIVLTLGEVKQICPVICEHSLVDRMPAGAIRGRRKPEGEEYFNDGSPPSQLDKNRRARNNCRDCSWNLPDLHSAA